MPATGSLGIIALRPFSRRRPSLVTVSIASFLDRVVVDYVVLAGGSGCLSGDVLAILHILFSGGICGAVLVGALLLMRL